jgi:hypothetical protein
MERELATMIVSPHHESRSGLFYAMSMTKKRLVEDDRVGPDVNGQSHGQSDWEADGK